MGSGSLTPDQHTFHITPVQKEAFRPQSSGVLFKAIVTKGMDLSTYPRSAPLSLASQMGIFPVSDPGSASVA